MRSQKEWTVASTARPAIAQSSTCPATNRKSVSESAELGLALADRAEIKKVTAPHMRACICIGIGRGMGARRALGHHRSYRHHFAVVVSSSPGCP
jgi:hypothetical protein